MFRVWEVLMNYDTLDKEGTIIALLIEVICALSTLIYLCSLHKLCNMVGLNDCVHIIIYRV